MRKQPNCIDLFARCGGLSLGFPNAGKDMFSKHTHTIKTFKYSLVDKLNYRLINNKSS